MSRIPRIVHAVFGLREQVEPFAPMHYIALRSAIDHLSPERVMVHCDELPYGVYWDAIRPEIELHRIERIPEVDAVAPTNDAPEKYRYAHHADVIRLDALLTHGGVYLDLDTVTLAEFPEEWWDRSFVIGAETLSDDEHVERRSEADGPTLSLLNAVMMAEPNSPFARRWRASILDRLDGSWSGHSCHLARELADAHPDEVTIVAPAAFADFPPTVDALSTLLNESPEVGASEPPHHGDGRYVIHLCAHLWWEEGRTDFLARSGPDLTEHWYRTSTSVYARVARRYLPNLPTLA